MTAVGDTVSGSGESRAPAREDRFTGDAIVREVFFFTSGADRLYGSLYASTEPPRLSGLVVCPSFGFEMSRYQDTAHALALGLATMGGAGLVFHPPGHGDSGGDIRTASVARQVEAAVDAFGEARSRVPDVQWGLAGVRLGAAVACLATRRVPAGRLVLLQPETDPAAFFAAMKRSATRGALGGPGAEDAPFGYPLGAEVEAGDPGLDVAGALGSFGDRGLIVHHDLSDPPAAAPGGFDVQVVAGRWQPRLRLDEPLVAAALAWMKDVGRRR